MKEKVLNIPFKHFWDAYQKKVGKLSKIEKKWNALKDSERSAIMEHIPKYIASQPNKQFRKNPETYLNNESWNDEIIVSTNGKAITETRRNELDDLQEFARNVMGVFEPSQT